MNIIESAKNIDWSNPKSIAKVIGGLFLLLLMLVIAFYFLMFALSLIATPFNQARNKALPSAPFGYPAAEERAVNYADDSFGSTFSAQNLVPPRPGGGGTVGFDGESFEVTHYNATYKSGRIERLCDAVEELKPFEHVIFENAHRYDRNCSYTFKVEKERSEEVLNRLQELKPEEISENTTSIQLTVQGYTDQIEILEKKLGSIEATLTEAQDAYDEVTVLATRTQDVENLAKIIDSKVRLIERLTQERISIAQQIDSLGKQKALQLDRLAFTFFNVYVYEEKLIDFTSLKDSWVYELKNFTREINQLAQGVTLNLVLFMAKFVVAVVFFFVALFFTKYAWRLTKRIWRA